ncbi:SPOR domain-containing protein [Candidatus Omnitrophota bacterium]
MRKIIAASIVVAIAMVICVFSAFADIDTLRANFLMGDFHQTIIDGKVVLAQELSSAIACEANFYMGVSYMKQEWYDEARQHLSKAAGDFSGCVFASRALLSLGDTYLLEGQLEQALEIYKDAYAQYKDSDSASLIVFRLAQTNLKLGHWQEADKFFKVHKEQFPNSPMIKRAGELAAQEHIFTVQVGAFIHKNSAKGLVKKLKESGMDAYIMKVKAKSGLLYRVRVGKVQTRQEAKSLEFRLSELGYPTLIHP